MPDSFGGIEVDEPQTDQFGGIAVEETPAAPPLKPVTAAEVEANINPYERARRVLPPGRMTPFGPENPQEILAIPQALEVVPAIAGRVLAAGARTIRDIVNPSTYLPPSEVKKPFVMSREGELREQTPQELAEREPIQAGRPLYQPTAEYPSDAERMLMSLSTPESIAMLAGGGTSRLAGGLLLASMAPGVYRDIIGIAGGQGTPEEKRDRVNNLLLPVILAARAGMRGRAPAELTPSEAGVREVSGSPRGPVPGTDVLGQPVPREVQPPPIPTAPVPPRAPQPPPVPTAPVPPRPPEVKTMGPAEAGGKDLLGNPLGTKYYSTPEDWAKWQDIRQQFKRLMAEGKLDEANKLLFAGSEQLKNKYGGNVPEPPKGTELPPGPAPTTQPPPAPGMVRLYHGEGGPGGGGADTGFFSRSPDRARTYGPNVTFVDVPAAVAEAAEKARQAKGTGTAGDAILADEWAKQAKPLAGGVPAKVFDTEPVTKPPAKLTAAAYMPQGAMVPETGPHHPAILKRLGITGFETPESRNTQQFGFVDENGAFLTREQAAERAKLTGQDLKTFEPGEPAHSDEVASATKPGIPISEDKSVPTGPAPAPGELLAIPQQVAPSATLQRTQIVRLLEQLEEEDQFGKISQREVPEEEWENFSKAIAGTLGRPWGDVLNMEQEGAIKALRERLGEIEKAKREGREPSPLPKAPTDLPNASLARLQSVFRDWDAEKQGASSVDLLDHVENLEYDNPEHLPAELKQVMEEYRAAVEDSDEEARKVEPRFIAEVAKAIGEPIPPEVAAEIEKGKIIPLPGTPPAEAPTPAPAPTTPPIDLESTVRGPGVSEGPIERLRGEAIKQLGLKNWANPQNFSKANDAAIQKKMLEIAKAHPRFNELFNESQGRIFHKATGQPILGPRSASAEGWETGMPAPAAPEPAKPAAQPPVAPPPAPRAPAVETPLTTEGPLLTRVKKPPELQAMIDRRNQLREELETVIEQGKENNRQAGKVTLNSPEWKPLYQQAQRIDARRDKINQELSPLEGKVSDALWELEKSVARTLPAPTGALPKVTAKVLKAQKENLLSQLDQAIKEAPETGKEKIKLSVPTDGDFTLVNNKAALKTFKATVQKEFPEAVPTDKGPSVPTGKARALPKASEPKPKDLPKIAGAFVTDDKTRFAIQTVYSDGTQMVATDGRRLMRVVTDDAPGTPAEPVRLTPEGKIDPDAAEADFPNWKAVRSPNPTLAKGGFDIEQLWKIGRQAQALLKDAKSNAMELYLNPDGTFGGKAENPGVGEFEHNVQPKAFFLGGVNPDYLVEGLEAGRKLGNEKLDLYVDGEEGPFVFVGKNHEYTLMGVRTRAAAEGVQTPPPARDDPKALRMAMTGQKSFVRPPDGLGPLRNPEAPTSRIADTDQGKFEVTYSKGEFKLEKVPPAQGRYQPPSLDAGTFAFDKEKDSLPTAEEIRTTAGGKLDVQLNGKTVNSILSEMRSLAQDRRALIEEGQRRMAAPKKPTSHAQVIDANSETAELGEGGETGAEMSRHNTPSGLPPSVPDNGPNFPAELLETSRQLGTLVRSRVTLPRGIGGWYVRTRSAIAQTDRIEVGDIRNQLTVAHEMGHDIDALIWPKVELAKTQQSLAQRVGDAVLDMTGNRVTGKELQNELIPISELMRGPISGSKGHIAYRKSAAELIADFFALYAHDPQRARGMAPMFSTGFERALGEHAEAGGVINQLLEGNIVPVTAETEAPGPAATPQETPGAVPSRPLADPVKRDLPAAQKGEELVKGLVREFAARVEHARIVADQWRDKVPSRDERADVGAFVEGIGNVEHAGDTIENVKARMTPAMEQLAKTYRFEIEAQRQDINRYLKDSEQGEYLKFLEDYLPHFYANIGTPAGRSALSRFMRHSPNAKQRKLPTVREAVDLGLIPITQDPAVLYEHHAAVNWRTATNRKLMQALKEMTLSDGTPAVVPAKDAPAGWVITQNPLVQKVYAHQVPNGVMIWKGGAAVHPDVWRAARQMLDLPVSSDFGKAYDALNAVTRANAFAFSLFHDITLRSAALGEAMQWYNPVRGLFRLFERDPKTGELKILQSARGAGRELLKDEETVADAARHGLKFAWTDSESYQHNARDFLEKQAAKLRDVPVLGKAAGLARDLQHMRQVSLWKNTHDAFKILAYHDAVAKALDTAPPGTDPKLVKETIASKLNDAFGGQEWQTHFWLSPQLRHTMSRFLLAPDWTFSTVRSIPGASDVASALRSQASRLSGRGVGPASYEGVTGNLGRARFWGGEIAALATATLAAQYAIYQAFGDPQKGDKPWVWENEEGQGRRVDVTPLLRQLPWHDRKDPTRYYVNLGKRPEEILGWFTHMDTQIQSKMSRPVAEIFKQVSGDEGLFKAPWKMDHETFLESLPQRALSAGKELVPFVFAGNQFALSVPYRKGMTKFKAQQAYESVYEMLADPGLMPTQLKAFLRGVPAPEGTLRSMVSQITDAAKRNGVPAEQIRARALSEVRGHHYDLFFKAFQKQDRQVMEREAEALRKLGATVEERMQSLKRRQALQPRPVNQ